jgi:hypothetical protein
MFGRRYAPVFLVTTVLPVGAPLCVSASNPNWRISWQPSLSSARAQKPICCLRKLEKTELSRTGTRNDWINDDEHDAPDSRRSRPSHRRPERPYRAPSRRQTETEEFKCGHCKTFVGPPISGGRHRNHCPLCLYSKHVDRAPGDRKNECRSLMEPIGTAFRRNGEQVIVHRCLGCGEVRYCRAAADDHLLICMRLPPMELPTRVQSEELDEAIA